MRLNNNKVTNSILIALKRVPSEEVARVFALTVLVTMVWCVTYNRMTIASWSVPVASYSWDGWWNLATIKAYQEGELSPFSWMIVRSLNAPFIANWNDFPTSEKMLPYFIGILARLFGLIPALNLACLLASILAACAFYITCRILRYPWMFSFAIAVVYSFSHYMSARLQMHLVLSYYFHIPFFLLVTWWCLDTKELLINSSRWWCAVAIAALTGFCAIYYAFLFWQLMGFAIIAQLLRRNIAKFKSVVAITAVSVACTLSMAVPNQMYRMMHGSNTAVVERGLAGLEIYGLKLPELFLPPAHRWKALFDFGQANYFEPAFIRGEMGSPYLGLAGIAGLVWLIGLGVANLLKGRAWRIPVMFWQVLWIVVFSLIGGVNLILGASGLQLFRATNRYSIVILCLSLLFLTRMLASICQPAHRPVLALLIVSIGLWDILPPFVDDLGIQAVEKIINDDSAFVQSLEQKVSPRTMVFQLPVMEFPEVPPRFGAQDYSNFRPYLHSRNLHFSYGSDKGRAREGWQRDMELLPAKEMAEKLESFGFGVILINRAGFADSAESLLRDLTATGRKVIEKHARGEFIAVGLQPSSRTVLPEIPPFPGTGFYGWEGDWRKGAHSWSKGNATLVLTNTSDNPIKKQYTFSLGTLAKRRVSIITPDQTKAVDLDPGTNATIGPITIQMVPGETQLRFETDTPTTAAGPGDTRHLAFSVALLPTEPPKAVPVLGSSFYGWEGDWHNGAHSWSRGAGTLVFVNSDKKVLTGRYSFSLNSMSRRHVTVVTPSTTKTVELNPGHPVTVGPFDFRFEPGETTIRFETDRPAVLAGSGDPRALTFSLAILPPP